MSDAEARQMIGKRLKLYWSGDRRWFKGEIVRFRCKRGERMHTVQYDDGDVEEHDLSEGGGERWEWLPAGREPAFCEL